MDGPRGFQPVFSDDDDDSDEGELVDLDNPEAAIGAALNFGLSTDAITARREIEQEGDGEFVPPPPPPETQQERLERKIREPAIKKGSPVKLPAHVVEKGRKKVTEKKQRAQQH